MQSRYSDGTYPVWYGSLDTMTTIYETTYHMRQSIKAIDGYHNEDIITRRRSVYDVFCDSILLDVVALEHYQQTLTQDDYSFTNTLGREAKSANIPGILSPSARYSGGINANVFKQSILSDPELNTVLEYMYITKNNMITVYQNSKELLQIM